MELCYKAKKSKNNYYKVVETKIRTIHVLKATSGGGRVCWGDKNFND